MFFGDGNPRDQAPMRHAALDRSEGAILAPPVLAGSPAGQLTNSKIAKGSPKNTGYLGECGARGSLFWSILRTSVGLSRSTR